MNDRAYARCKACNKGIYPAWIERRKQFEDMCADCRQASTFAARVDPTLYGADPEQWLDMPNEEETEAKYLEGYMSDKLGDSGDLSLEDEYHQYGEGAFGDPNLFDHY